MSYDPPLSLPFASLLLVFSHRVLTQCMWTHLPRIERRRYNVRNRLNHRSAVPSYHHIAVPHNEAISSTCIVVPSKLESKENEAAYELAHSLAVKLGLTLITDDDSRMHPNAVDSTPFTHSLHFIPYSIAHTHTFALAIRPFASKIQPFYVDFCPPLGTRMGQRLHRSDHQPTAELLLKAISIKKYRQGQASSSGPVIFDLTTGFAQDSLLIAGDDSVQAVHMVERHAIVAELLDDALRRTRFIASLNSSFNEEDDTYPIILHAQNLQSRLSLHKMDAQSFIQTVQSPRDDLFSCIGTPNVCYLDPMFPPRTKSAAVKKNMQILQGLLHSSPIIQEESDITQQRRTYEEQSLLDAALSISNDRVVVKRPIYAEPLGGRNYNKPSYSLQGSINRWDVYVLS